MVVPEASVAAADALLGNEILTRHNWTDLRFQKRGAHRPFKANWWVLGDVSSEERLRLSHLRVELDKFFRKHYGDTFGPPTLSQFTFRAHPTGPEPMHYDKEKGLVITAFVNVSLNPRVWRLGPKRTHPGPPYQVDNDAGHKVEFEPGTLWVFRAETVAHQVVEGDCCVQYNWHCGLWAGATT